MSTFSASDAAIEGFRVIRRHPGAVVAWAIAQVLLQLIFVGLMVVLFGGQFAALSQFATPGTPPSPEAAMRLVGFSFSLLIVFLPIGLIAGSVLVNAIFRPVLRPQDRGLFYLKLGGDEWRIILLQFAWFGVSVLAYVALVILAVIFTVILTLATGGKGGAPAALGAVIGVIALFCVLIWLAVRFSLAGPMTFAEKRVRVFGSWAITRGRFWSLFGCYLLASVLAFVVIIVGVVIASVVAAVAFGASGGLMAFNMTPGDPSVGARALAQLLTVGGVVRAVIQALFSTVGNVIVISAVAAAYRGLTHKEEDVFSD